MVWHGVARTKGSCSRTVWSAACSDIWIAKVRLNEDDCIDRCNWHPLKETTIRGRKLHGPSYRCLHSYRDGKNIQKHDWTSTKRNTLGNEHSHCAQQREINLASPSRRRQAPNHRKIFAAGKRFTFGLQQEGRPPPFSSSLWMANDASVWCAIQMQRCCVCYP